MSKNGGDDLHATESAVARCYSTWGERYYADYYGPDAPYPPVHRDLVATLLDQHGVKRLLDAGCGPASILRHLTRPGREIFGFDLTPAMIEEAQRVMAPLGTPAQRLWIGSVLDAKAYAQPGERAGGYDGAICIGVLPHLPEAQDETLIANMHASLRPGGLAVVEARNELFSLFTMNRYSNEFFMDRLISRETLARGVGGEGPALDQALSNLKAMFRTDIPPMRRGYKDEPGYDEILSRLHNPLVLAKQFAAGGFTQVRTLFYHFHCLPPMFGSQVPQTFRKHSLEMEANPEDWRGYFMASAFVIAAVRA